MRSAEPVYIEHGQYYIKHGETEIPFVEDTALPDGQLLFPNDGTPNGGIYVRTGTFFGPVTMDVEIYEGPGSPTPPDGTWEVVNEATLTARGKNLYLFAGLELIEEFPVLDLAPGDVYGVRLSVRGYTEAAEIQELLYDDIPVEHHFIQMWRTT